MKFSSSFLNFNVTVISIILTSYFLKAIVGIAVPIVLGVFFGIIFAPILLYLRKRNIPVFLIILIILVLFLFVCYLFTVIMIESITSIAENYDKYQERFIFLFDNLKHKLGFSDPLAFDAVQKYVLNFFKNNIFGYSKTLVQTLLSFGSAYLVVAITMLFVLLERSVVDAKINALESNSTEKKSLITIIENINVEVSRFVFLKALISFATATVIFIGFRIIGVDFAFIWAVLTLLFNFIPTIGSVFVTLLSVAFSILQFLPQFGPVIAVLVLTSATQMIIGNFLDPKIMGDNLNLSPLVIWLSLLYWTWVWGIVGALLAIPLTVSIRIVCEYVPVLKPMGIFLGNTKNIIKNQHKNLEDTE